MSGVMCREMTTQEEGGGADLGEDSVPTTTTLGEWVTMQTQKNQLVSTTFLGGSELERSDAPSCNVAFDMTLDHTQYPRLSNSPPEDLYLPRNFVHCHFFSSKSFVPTSLEGHTLPFSSEWVFSLPILLRG